MASEARRGCGYRKVGGLYLVAPPEGWTGCDRMPIKLTVCPTCNEGVKQCRGWKYINLNKFTQGVHIEGCTCSPACPVCGAYSCLDKVGLLWIGESFYPSIAAYNDEAKNLGISRRIRAIPKDFKIGVTWVALAHPKGFKCGKCQGSGIHDDEECEHCNGKGCFAAIFRVFKPTGIEKIITRTESQNEEEMKKLADRGVTPVVVEDNDKDHQGSVYDDESAPEVAPMTLEVQ